MHSEMRDVGNRPKITIDLAGKSFLHPLEKTHLAYKTVRRGSESKVLFHKPPCFTPGFILMIRLRLTVCRLYGHTGLLREKRLPREAGSPQLLNIIPSCLPVVYLSLCWILLENPLVNFHERWPLFGLSAGTSHEVEQFICSVLTTSEAHSRRLLAVLMTSKFDMRRHAKACRLVDLCLSPKRLTTASCSLIKLSSGTEPHKSPGTRVAGSICLPLFTQVKVDRISDVPQMRLSKGKKEADFLAESLQHRQVHNGSGPW